MCLDNISKKKTAILPLIVFKGIGWSRDVLPDSYRSGYQFKYLKGQETVKVEIAVDDEGEVNDGYHSYRFLINDASHNCHGIFIIPRGASYYNGKNNGNTYGRCASSMIYVGPASLKNYLKALWMKLTLVTTKHKS